MYLISIKIIQMLMQILVKKRATRILVLIIYGCFNKFRKIEATSTESKKQCFEEYCSCDQACQFSTLQSTICRIYLENLTIDDKFINKRVRLFIHQTLCREEKNISTS